MKNQPNKATVKDGLPTAKEIIDKHALKLFPETYTGEISSCIIDAMQEYSDQQNAELRERVKELEGTIAGYKECFEQFVPESKWDEATAFLSSYGNGLAKDLQRKENQ